MSKAKTERGYSTKYALTIGIQAVTVDLEASNGKTYAYTVPNEYIGHRQQLRRGKEYFTDPADAIQNAKMRAERKVTALKKELASMERLAANPALTWETKR